MVPRPVPRRLRLLTAGRRALGAALILLGVGFAVRHFEIWEHLVLWLAGPLIVAAAWLGWAKARLPVIPAALILTADGLEIQRPCGNTSVVWSEIVRIAAWQDDLFGIDCLCLGFSIAKDPDNLIATDEQMSGWEQLLAAANERFGLSPNWQLRVMRTAFDENFEVLWTKPSL